MGQRANIVLLERGQRRVLSSHWAADRLDAFLFWGPEHALAFARSLEEVGQDELLDEVWAEGGAVLDVDRKELWFFGGLDIVYDVPLRRALLALMREVWVGWRVVWAHEGLADLADRAGLPRAQVLTAGDGEGIRTLNPPAEPDWLDLVGSVRRLDGELRFFSLPGNAEEYVAAGPPLVEALCRDEGEPSLDVAGRTATFPTGGFQVEVATREVELWVARPLPHLEHRLARRWPAEWTVRWLRDGFERQLERAGGALRFPERTWDQLVAELRGVLLRPERRSSADTFRRLADDRHAMGHDVQVNPSALREDGGPPPLSVRERIFARALDALSRSPRS